MRYGPDGAPQKHKELALSLCKAQPRGLQHPGCHQFILQVVVVVVMGRQMDLVKRTMCSARRTSAFPSFHAVCCLVQALVGLVGCNMARDP